MATFSSSPPGLHAHGAGAEGLSGRRFVQPALVSAAQAATVACHRL